MAKKAASASKSASKSAPKAKAAPAKAAKPAAKAAAKTASKSAPAPKEKAKAAAKPVKALKAKPEVEEADDLEATEEAAEEMEAAPVETSKKPAKKEKKPRKTDGAAAAASEDHQRWLQLRDQHGKEKPAPYRMADQFSANSPLMHPSLGWGYVLSNLNDRLEVLFESGLKVLISNYNPK